MSGHDSKYFSTTKKGEIPELKEELNSQYKTSHFGPGAGKSMDIMRSTTESSGPRHVRSRGISASARRERVHYFEDDEDDDGDEEEEEEEEVDTDEVIDDQSGPYDDYGPSSRRLDDMYETRRVDVRKGRDGRFVSRFGTSSASTVFV